MVREIVQNMLVYVVMVTILRGLISDKGFLEMFRFVSGLILILLFTSPVLSVLPLDMGWYQKLEENIFQIDKMQLEQELKVADGSFEKVLWKECEGQVEEQIRELVRENGQEAGEVRVSLEAGEDGHWSVAGIYMTIGQEAQEAMSQGEGGAGRKEAPGEDAAVETGESAIKEIPKIVIEPGTEPPEDGQGFLEDGDTHRIKKKICRKYQLPEEVVDVWRINGEND